MTSQPAKRRVELQVERVRKGLSQEAAAEQIGIERRVLIRAERGGSVKLEHVEKIVAFYGRPFEELFAATLDEAA